MSRRSREGDPGLRQELIDTHDHDKSGDLDQNEIDAAEVVEAIEGDTASLQELNLMEREQADLEAAKAKVGAIEIIKESEEGVPEKVTIEIPQENDLSDEEREALKQEFEEKGVEIPQRPEQDLKKKKPMSRTAADAALVGARGSIAAIYYAKRLAQLAMKPFAWPIKKLNDLVYGGLKSWDDEGLKILERTDVLKPEEKKDDKKAA